jgi:hypothetical protein
MSTPPYIFCRQGQIVEPFALWFVYSISGITEIICLYTLYRILRNTKESFLAIILILMISNNIMNCWFVRSNYQY